MSTVSQSVPVQQAEKLRVELSKGPIRFGFVKKDKANVRYALGTTNLSNIPREKHPKGGGRPAVKTVPFFDLTINSWRSVSVESVVFGEM